MNSEVLIKRFQIKELFGIYNVDIPFENYVNIFVGENGLGKTTILNCLNYVLQGDVDNLYNTDFKEIIITLSNDKIINIKHDNLIPYNKYYRSKLRYSEIEIEESHNTIYNFLLDSYYKIQKDNSRLSKEKIKEVLLDNIRHYPFYVNSKVLIKMIDDIEKNKNNDWRFQIQNEITNPIIYLPTYRRIEEDFNKFINNDIKRDDNLSKKISNLQFGMDDVVKLIDNTRDQLRNTTNEGFKEMTGSLLKNYVSIIDNNEINDDSQNIEIEDSKLRIVFERLADKIDESVKNKIIELMQYRNNNDKQSKFFFSIISNLLDIYEKTKYMDESLDRFTKVCNDYLEKNTFVYNPYEITCELKQKVTDKKIEFKHLSSGEKQIISLFSKLYLSKASNNIILFDEPELSLSIKWQSKLLPDIIKTNKCEFIMVITHSPFIFDNEMKKYTKDIKNYITPIHNVNE